VSLTPTYGDLMLDSNSVGIAKPTRKLERPTTVGTG
jgi:hypothetical protein